MYAITSGDSNTAIGWRAAYGLTEGNFNTAVGDQSLAALTTGTGNVGVGASTLASVKTSGYNTGLGTDVLWNATSGYNTGVGAFAGADVVDGDNNVYIGYDAGNDNVSGDNNVAVGNHAGETNTGSGNVFLGYKAGEDSGAVSNTLYIDNSDDTTPLIYGDFSTDKVTINEDLDVADDLTVTGTINTPGDAKIKTDGTSARDLTIVTGADKTLVLDTVVFDDVRVPITSTKAGGSKDPHFSVFKTNGTGSQGVFLYWFDASAEEELYFTVQMPHGYKLDTTIIPHVHWTPSVTADGTPANQVVRWGFEYTWADKGQTFGNTSISYASTHYPADANVVAGKHYYSEFATLTPTATAGKDISSMLICRIFRDATSLTDNYEQDAGILEFDIHYGIDTLGSRTDLSK
jgi:hypothetical protein